GIWEGSTHSKISGWISPQFIFPWTVPSLNCSSAATHSILPAAARQCPTDPLVELIKGKSLPDRSNAKDQFLISSVSFEVAVKCPLITSTAFLPTLASSSAPIIHC